MAKKKKASASRKPAGRSKTARKTTSRKTTKRKTTSRRKTASSRASGGGGELKLSALRRQLERVIKRMDRDPGHDTKTREIFMSWTEEIDDICHPDNPDGCGPIMVFPEG